MPRPHLKQVAQATAPQAAKPAPAPPPAAANSSAPPKAHNTAGVPPVTTEDPWRHLHPSRVWPD
jgi:hypothetical protein